MELAKLIWDVLKTLWGVGKKLGPYIVRQFRLGRSPWLKLVRRGGSAIGTPAHDIEALVDALDDPVFYSGSASDPMLDDIRTSVWHVYQRIDELRLLAVAGSNVPDQERCWAINQLGQRAGTYAVEVLRAIGDSLSTPEQVKRCALHAVSEIQSRNSRQNSHEWCRGSQ